MNDITLKAIKLVDFWYKTDFENFNTIHEGIEDAIKQAADCIENHLDRTIEIIRQDIDEQEDADFTEQAENIIRVISE